METFEAGVKCIWTGHTFRPGEQARKCVQCRERVMKISAWDEKRHCFCGSTNVVEAIATTPDIQRTPIIWRDPIPNNPNNTTINDNFSPQLRAYFFKWLGYISVGGFLLFSIYVTPLKKLADFSFWQSLVSQVQSQISKFNRESPEQFVRNYYSLVNNRQYLVAWKNLSTDFQNNKKVNDRGYQSYVEFWQTVEKVDIIQTSVELNTEQNAIVYIQIRDFIKAKNKSVDEAHRLFLVWNKKTSSWLIDSPTDLEALLTKVPEITDPSQLRALNRQIYNIINPAWTTRSGLKQDLVYGVGVAADGAIAGYKAVNQEANDAVEQTPLPKLLYKPDKRSQITNEPIAQFRVAFNRNGVLQVSPWRGYTKTPDVIKVKITDPNTLKDLNKKLYEMIRKNWSGTPTYTRDLKYRVAVNKDGVIADYEPLNQPAVDYFRGTPLPKMFQDVYGSNFAPLNNKESLTHFQVVFKPNGVLEVSRWQGYR